MIAAVAPKVLQLEKMLLPLWAQGGTEPSWTAKNKRHELAEIVMAAAGLNQRMRLDGETVYSWPPTFKDEEFEPERMESFNLAEMITQSPYKRKEINGSERAILPKGSEHKSEAIVRVVCFPGLVAYAQGGGDVAKRELAGEDDHATRPKTNKRHRAEDEPSGDDGFRTKVLSKSVVLLQWGKQRLLTKEAGTGRHIQAMKEGSKKYEVDYEGFVELYDVFLKRTQQEREALQPNGSWLPDVSRLWSPSRSPSQGA